MGEPTDDLKGQLLSEIRVTRGEMLAFRVKAAIATRGDISRLACDAIRAYQAPPLPLPTPCPNCGATTVVGVAERSYKRVRFTGVPVYVCPHCAWTGVDARIAVALEDIAEQVAGSGLTIEVDDLMGPNGPNLVADLVEEPTNI